MRRLASLVPLLALFITSPAASASARRHLVSVPLAGSSAFAFTLPASVFAERVPGTPRTHGELTRNTPRCRGVVDGRCPASTYDAAALPGSSPLDALRRVAARDEIHPLAHGTNRQGVVWDRFRGGGLVLVAPVSCATLRPRPVRLCGESTHGTRYLALLLTGSGSPTLLTGSVDATITASVRFAKN